MNISSWLRRRQVFLSHLLDVRSRFVTVASGWAMVLIGAVFLDPILKSLQGFIRHVFAGILLGLSLPLLRSLDVI